MDIQSVLKNLHPLEIKVLKNFKIGEGLYAKKLQEVLQYKEGHANQAFSWLKLKELVKEKTRKTTVVYELTELGKDYAKNGLPAERIILLLKEAGPLKLPEIAQKLGLQNKDVGSSFGELSKAGCAAMNDEKKAAYIKDPDDKNFLLKKALLKRAAEAAECRLPEDSLTEDEKACIADIAKKRGIPYRFVETDIPDAHPNTARIHFLTRDGAEGSVQGASIGGGNIRVDFVNGLRVDFTGENNTILVLHRDRPGLIASVTNLIYEEYRDINIGNFRLSRRERGGLALMTIEIDQVPPDQMVEEIQNLRDVEKALLIRAS